MAENAGHGHRETVKQGGLGRIIEVKGPVVDARFDSEDIPEIYNALTVEFQPEGEEPQELTLEVQQLLGDDVVRAVAMGATDGVKRGLDVRDTGQPISVPVGKNVLGRVLDVLGQPVDEQGEIGGDDEEQRAAHAQEGERRAGPAQEHGEGAEAAHDGGPQHGRLGPDHHHEDHQPESEVAQVRQKIRRPVLLGGRGVDHREPEQGEPESDHQ